LYVPPKGIIAVASNHSRRADVRADVRADARVDALAHVANRPIAHHVLDALESAGVEEIVVVTPTTLTEQVRSSFSLRQHRVGTQLHYVEHRGPLALCDSLSLAAPIVGSAPCIVHLANGLLGEPLGPIVGQVGDGPDVFLIVHHGAAPDEHLSPQTQAMLHLAELDRKRAALGMTGVCAFGPDALRCARPASGAAPDADHLTAAAEHIAAAGGRFHVRVADTWRRYSGDPLDLLALNRMALDRINTDPHPMSSNGNRIEGPVQIDDSASVHDSVIIGPTVVGPEASITDAYIGPYTSVGPGACIEGAEIERSIISAGASIMHVGGRLVSSIVGREARIFRDFSLPRALRIYVSDGDEIALC
jgi:glucose-1-phosphate thymidylyltransferase